MELLPYQLRVTLRQSLQWKSPGLERLDEHHSHFCILVDAMMKLAEAPLGNRTPRFIGCL